MGYTTEFKGAFKLDKKLKQAEIDYLKAFSASRRMARDVTQLSSTPVMKAVNVDMGIEGANYVSENSGNFGQNATEEVIDFNSPPDPLPSLWCQWIPTEDGMSIVWDESEKFYNYTDWISYLIETFLKPWGYTVNGEVIWRGEDTEDVGVIEVKDNVVRKYYGVTSI